MQAILCILILFVLQLKLYPQIGTLWLEKKARETAYEMERAPERIGLSLTNKIGTRLHYDDNILQLNDRFGRGEVKDYVFMPYLDGRINYIQSQKMRTSLSYLLDHAQYAHNPSDNYDEGRFYLSNLLETPYVTFTLSNSTLWETTPTTLLVTRRSDRFSNISTLGADVTLTPLISVSSSAGLEFINAEERELDTLDGRRFNIPLRILYHVNPFVSTGLYTSYTKFNYDEFRQNDFETFDNGLSATYTPSENVSFSGNLGYAKTLVTRSPRTDTRIITASLTGTVALTEQIILYADYSRGIDASPTAFFRRSNRATLWLDYAISPYTNMFLRLIYEDSKPVGISKQTKVQPIIELDQIISENLRVEAGYTWTNLDSTDINYDYSQNLLFFGFVYYF